MRRPETVRLCFAKTLAVVKQHLTAGETRDLHADDYEDAAGAKVG